MILSIASRVTLLSLLLPALASAAGPSVHHLRVRGQELRFSPSAGRLSTAGGKALPRSAVFSDSKAQAFSLDSKTVVKLYAGRPDDEDRDLQRLGSLGLRESIVMSAWAEQNLAEPVHESKLSDGVFYSVLAKPRGGVSVASLVKAGRLDEKALAKVAELASALTRGLWRLDTLNPTQVHIDGQGRPRLIKAYSEDKQVAEAERPQLERLYAAKAEQFVTLADVYPGLKRSRPLSDGSPSDSPTEITRLVAEAARAGRPLRLVHQKPNDRARTFEVKLVPETLRHDNLMKGYLHAQVYPKPGTENRSYTFRLDRILSAELLGQNALKPKPEYVRLPRSWTRLTARRAAKLLRESDPILYWPPHGEPVAVAVSPQLARLVRSGLARVYENPRSRERYFTLPRGAAKAALVALAALQHASAMFDKGYERFLKLTRSGHGAEITEQARTALPRLRKDVELYERRRREFAAQLRGALGDAGDDVREVVAQLLKTAIDALARPDGSDTRLRQALELLGAATTEVVPLPSTSARGPGSDAI